MELKTRSLSLRAKAGPSKGHTKDEVCRAMIFAHWDRNGLVDDHVLYSLEKYRPWVSTLIFVSSNLTRTSRPLERICDVVVRRQNKGYDYGSWKKGLGLLKIPAYHEVVFTNDSIYGPLQPMQNVFLRKEVTAGDVWGMTTSHEHNQRHLQSYFFAMKRKVLLSEYGKSFWRDVGGGINQRCVVEQFEMPFLKELEQEGFKVRTFFDAGRALEIPWREKVVNLMRGPKKFRSVRRYLDACRHKPYNPTHLQWRQCVDAGVPFIKADLFRDNPNHLRIGPVRRWIAANTDYPVDLIRHHQSRLARQTL
jgi:rhamnosyltransferase